MPALPDFFVVMRYLRAYDTLHRLGKLSPAEVEAIEEMVGHSIDYLLQTSEWGAMNRTMLRAESLAWAVRALPKHPRAAVWEKQRQALGDDNWGNWEIEDATIYHGVWLYALMGYADALGKLDELFRTPEVYYYAHYFLNLMSPAGVVPDFGDAAWTQNWQHFFVFFEAAAARLNDPTMEWAAQQIAARFIDFSTPNNVGPGLLPARRHRWGRDDIQPAAPTQLSGEVMEDVQGKKIVFRNGWKPESTYLLLNYRDEGDGGMNFRDYLRDSIPVEEEKMTHGHADENSIVLLMSGGSVLLHDGGYRDYMPSGPFGAYRQDYFHNRLVVRPEKIFMGQSRGDERYSTKEAVPAQPLLEFLRDAGSYRPVRTRKVDFLSLPEFDYSRTRLIDDGWGYDYDRVVVYVKDPEMFVVFDIFKSRTDEYFTLANLWHTRKIYAQGEHWYDTGYDVIGQQALPDAKRLLVLFPSTHFRMEGVEPQKRHYQDELTIHQTAAHHFEQRQTEGFVTVLVPHAKDVEPATLVVPRAHRRHRARARGAGGDDRGRRPADHRGRQAGPADGHRARLPAAAVHLREGPDRLRAARHRRRLRVRLRGRRHAVLHDRQHDARAVRQPGAVPVGPVVPRPAVRRHVRPGRRRQGPLLARHGARCRPMAAETSIRTGRPRVRRARSRSCAGSSSGAPSTSTSTASASAATARRTRGRCGSATTAT